MSNSHIIKTIFIKAPKETVWAFLTEKDKLALWFQKAKGDLQPDSEYGLLAPNSDPDDDPQCWGRVLEMDAPNRLVYTFTHPWLKGSETTVTWELNDALGGTRLKLTHEGFEKAPVDVLEQLCDHDKGWDEHFARLREVAASA